MVSFILAGIVFFGTLLICAFMGFAAGMSDSLSAANNVPVGSTFVIGMVITALLVGSHWLPHLSW